MQTHGGAFRRRSFPAYGTTSGRPEKRPTFWARLTVLRRTEARPCLLGNWIANRRGHRVGSGPEVDGPADGPKWQGLTTSSARAPPTAVQCANRLTSCSARAFAALLSSRLACEAMREKSDDVVDQRARLSAFSAALRERRARRVHLIRTVNGARSSEGRVNEWLEGEMQTH